VAKLLVVSGDTVEIARTTQSSQRLAECHPALLIWIKALNPTQHQPYDHVESG